MAAKFGLRHVTYQLDVLELDDLVVVSQGDGKEQLVVLATIQGAGVDIHIELFGHDSGLVVNGYALLIDAAAGVTLLADVYEF